MLNLSVFAFALKAQMAASVLSRAGCKPLVAYLAHDADANALAFAYGHLNRCCAAPRDRPGQWQGLVEHRDGMRTGGDKRKLKVALGIGAYRVALVQVHLAPAALFLLACWGPLWLVSKEHSAFAASAALQRLAVQRGTATASLLFPTQRDEERAASGGDQVER